MNATNIIGDPKEFAIEYAILPNLSPPFGRCRLWFAKIFLGDIEEEIYLSTTCYLLENVLKNKNKLFLDEKFNNIDESEIFNLMIEGKKINYSGIYEFMIVSGYDSFYNYIYRKDDDLCVVWMIDPEVQQEKKYQAYPSKICSAKVNINIYEEVVSNFRKKLEEICPFY